MSSSSTYRATAVRQRGEEMLKQFRPLLCSIIHPSIRHLNRCCNTSGKFRAATLTSTLRAVSLHRAKAKQQQSKHTQMTDQVHSRINCKKSSDISTKLADRQAKHI
jgi:hypothetical protein